MRDFALLDRVARALVPSGLPIWCAQGGWRWPPQHEQAAGMKRQIPFPGHAHRRAQGAGWLPRRILAAPPGRAGCLVCRFLGAGDRCSRRCLRRAGWLGFGEAGCRDGNRSRYRAEAGVGAGRQRPFHAHPARLDRLATGANATAELAVAGDLAAYLRPATGYRLRTVIGTPRPGDIALAIGNPGHLAAKSPGRGLSARHHHVRREDRGTGRTWPLQRHSDVPATPAWCGQRPGGPARAMDNARGRHHRLSALRLPWPAA